MLSVVCENIDDVRLAIEDVSAQLRKSNWHTYEKSLLKSVNGKQVSNVRKPTVLTNLRSSVTVSF